jgi:hypothetical protein
MKQTFTSFAIITTLCIPAFSQTKSPLTGDQAAVIKADEDYRVAKMTNDLDALRRVLSPDFYETNQNGNTRNYAETIDLWKTFRVTSLITESFDVRVTGDTAVMKGTQTEVRGGFVEPLLFTRVYVRSANGWRLLSSMQSNNPKRPSYTKLAAFGN